MNLLNSEPSVCPLKIVLLWLSISSCSNVKCLTIQYVERTILRGTCWFHQLDHSRDTPLLADVAISHWLLQLRTISNLLNSHWCHWTIFLAQTYCFTGGFLNSILSLVGRSCAMHFAQSFNPSGKHVDSQSPTRNGLCHIWIVTHSKLHEPSSIRLENSSWLSMLCSTLN